LLIGIGYSGFFLFEPAPKVRKNPFKCKSPGFNWNDCVVKSRKEIENKQSRFRDLTAARQEAKQGEMTIALTLANATDPKIPWINVFMTDAERAAVGITEAYKRRPGHPDEETIEYRVPQDEQREEFFIEQTLKEGPDAQSILMLLGDLHVDAVGDKLRKLGYPVMVNHGLFPVRRWRP
jgi:hypothetical protein